MEQPEWSPCFSNADRGEGGGTKNLFDTVFVLMLTAPREQTEWSPCIRNADKGGSQKMFGGDMWMVDLLGDVERLLAREVPAGQLVPHALDDVQRLPVERLGLLVFEVKELEDQDF